MKHLIFTFILTTAAFAQIDFDVKEVQFEEFVHLNELRCETNFGSDEPIENRSVTRLGHRITNQVNSEIVMEHGPARVMGCDFDLMDKFVKDSFMFFNHAKAMITIIKETAKDPRFVFGACQRNYREQLEFDFGNGIVLHTSKLGILIPATGC
jgi:hypothetical protein